MTVLNVNGRDYTIKADADTPLLYVLREELELNAAKYGCGRAQCGSCTVLIGDSPVFSCVTPLSSCAGKRVTTLEGLGTLNDPAPIQRAFIDEQAAQCGYCIAGMIMQAQSLLLKNANPTDTEIRSHMSPNLCRCGTHVRIVRAVRRAAELMREAKAASSPKGAEQ